jgi:hypothetical protein
MKIVTENTTELRFGYTLHGLLQIAKYASYDCRFAGRIPFAERVDVALSAVAEHVYRAEGAPTEAELRAVQPEIIVTLGRAAARVMHHLLELDEDGGSLKKDAYGDIAIVSCNDRPTQLLCLAHPGAPRSWQQPCGWATPTTTGRCSTSEACGGWRAARGLHASGATS